MTYSIDKIVRTIKDGLSLVTELKFLKNTPITFNPASTKLSLTIQCEISSIITLKAFVNELYIGTVTLPIGNDTINSDELAKALTRQVSNQEDKDIASDIAGNMTDSHQDLD